jgi:hypothetical protein
MVQLDPPAVSSVMFHVAVTLAAGSPQEGFTEATLTEKLSEVPLLVIVAGWY